MLQLDVSNPLIIEQIEIGPMQNFTYIVGFRETREVAVIDPAWDIDELIARLEKSDYTLKAVLATHYHPDHVGGGMFGHKIAGVAELIAKLPVKVYANRHEVDGLRKVTCLSESDVARVDSGDVLKIGEVEIEFLHTPGHTPGSQCFRIRHTLVSGDTLFINGCGRVDLPGSDPDDMYRSLEKLKSLPDDTLLLPGHNYGHVPSATMAETKAQNAYLNVKSIDTWRQMMD